MQLQTISQVSKTYGISTRMLRYYEQVGLLQSVKQADYAYRMYDDQAINRLRQIIVLRKLRIPVKQIVAIINNEDAVTTIEIFRQKIEALDSEVTALGTIKGLLMRFVEDLNHQADVNIKLLGDEAVFTMVASLSFSDNQIKGNEEAITMDALNAADETLMKLEDKDVRIIFLPPMTVATAHATGEGCEGKALDLINQFTKTSHLLEIKPDARSFGFDCSPQAVNIGDNSQAYEVWVSIPEDLAVSEPLIKKQFKGGLYAAHVLRAWDFQDWRRLKTWVDGSEKYEDDGALSRVISEDNRYGQCLEETLNFYHFAGKHNGEMNYLQIDLLFPIKEK